MEAQDLGFRADVEYVIARRIFGLVCSPSEC